MTLEQKIMLISKSDTPELYKKSVEKKKGLDLKRVLTPSQYKSYENKLKNLWNFAGFFILKYS